MVRPPASGIGETAFSHRTDGYNLLVLFEWIDRVDTDRCVAWADQETITGGLEEFSEGALDILPQCPSG